MKWLRQLIDDVRFHVWLKHQNGNRTLQRMMSDLSFAEDQLYAAVHAIRAGDKQEALELVGAAHVTVLEHQETLREIL